MEMNEIGTKLPRLKWFPIYRYPIYGVCTVSMVLPNIGLLFAILVPPQQVTFFSFLPTFFAKV